MLLQTRRTFDERRPLLGMARIVSVRVAARDLAAARAFYAGALALPLVADDGLAVRLDAGEAVLDLRRAESGAVPRRAPAAAAGAPALAFRADDPRAVRARVAAHAGGAEPSPAPGRGAALRDPDGHAVALRAPAVPRPATRAPRCTLAELALPVPDPALAAALLADTLDLRPLERSADRVTYDGGGVRLAIVRAPDGVAGPAGTLAPVFHVEDLGDVVWRLAGRGVRAARTVAYDRAGGTARVGLPGGHHLWLWEPSDEARDGPGGRKLEALLAAPR